MAAKSPSVNADRRKELLSAIDGFAKRGGTTRDKALAAWYATTFLGVDEDEAIDAASVDGPGDNGCDFIYVDDEQAQIIVLQGYVSDRADRATPVKKWNALTAAVGSIKDPETSNTEGARIFMSACKKSRSMITVCSSALSRSPRRTEKFPDM